MTPLCAFRKPDVLQQGTQVVKTNRCVGGTAQNLAKRFLRSHAAILRRIAEACVIRRTVQRSAASRAGRMLRIRILITRHDGCNVLLGR